MKIKYSDNFQKKLKSLEKPEEISFKDLFNEDFMNEHTDFSNINELLAICGITTKEDLETKADILNLQVNEKTSFSNFKEMSLAAGKEHFKKKMKNLFK